MPRASSSTEPIDLSQQPQGKSPTFPACLPIGWQASVRIPSVRIALVQFSHETNPLCPAPTGPRDFRNNCYLPAAGAFPPDGELHGRHHRRGFAPEGRDGAHLRREGDALRLHRRRGCARNLQRNSRRSSAVDPWTDSVSSYMAPPAGPQNPTSRATPCRAVRKAWAG